MFLMLFVGSAALANDNTGTSGAVFLKIGPGARPVAMGEAYTGVADDIHSIYWNPAGLGFLKRPELTGMHMQYFQAIKYEFAAFAYPTESQGTWGFAVTNLHTDDLEARTEDTDASLGQFSANDSAYWLSYAYPVSSRLSVGANLKYIRQTLNDVQANAYATDGGLLYDTAWHDLRLGASMQNLGSRVKFVSESDPLPLTFRLGASAPVPLVSRNLRLASDLIMPRDHAMGVAVGGEYTGRLMDGLSYQVRSGYRTDSDVEGLSGVAAGGGLTFGRVSFDFAWVPFGELGNTYRYAIHIKFGAGDVEAQPNLQMQKARADDPLML
ncbi:MAG: PorV/PorQ family protein [Elusimicrobiota bacterium]|jgi:long-subunit fatty acid transport protein